MTQLRGDETEVVRAGDALAVLPEVRPLRSGALHPWRTTVLVVGALEAGLAVLWYRATPWSGRVTNGAQWLGTLSSFTALAGTLLLALTIVLSGRLRIVESALGGLDQVYRVHHAVGAAAFALVLVHPAFLAWKYAQISMERSAHLFGPSTRWPLLAGQVALYAMVPLLFATIFLTVRHQVLVGMQKALGVLFLPGAYHALFTGGDARRDAPLRAYLAIFVVAALLTLVKHSWLGRRLDRHAGYRVERVTPLPGGVVDVRLTAVDRQLSFVPGQFAYLRFPHDPIGPEPHPFSIASAPGGRELRFVVKDVGDWTEHLGEVRPGADAVVEGPYGRFSHRFVRGRRQVWVAGGIGVTPFLAMAASLGTRGCRYEVDLFYCYPSDDRAPALDELRALAAERPTLRVHAHCDARDGLVTAAALADATAATGGLAGAEVLLCGPPAMRDALREQLAAAGVPATRIHAEEFRYA